MDPTATPSAVSGSKNSDPLVAIHAALFEQLVRGHGHMAMMFLGKLENPQTGRHEEPEPAGAKIFIDQLDMLAAKTRGNLSERETAILQETLTSTQLAFAEVLRVAKQEDEAANPPT